MAEMKNWKKVVEKLCLGSCRVYNFVGRKGVVRYGFKWQGERAVVFQSKPMPFLKKVDVFEDKRYLMFYMEYNGGRKIDLHDRGVTCSIPFFYDRKSPFYKYKGWVRVVKHDEWPGFMHGTEKWYALKREVSDLPEANKFSKKSKAYGDWFFYQMSLRLSKKEFVLFHGCDEEEYEKIIAYGVVPE